MYTALVTGASRGLGLEFVRQLAEQGWRVLACCRQPEAATALLALAQQSEGRVSLYALSVEQPEQMTALAAKLEGQAIDLLINNAGVYPGGLAESFGHTSTAEWLRAFEINTIAPLKMAEAFVEHVAKSRLKVIATLSSKMGSMSDNTSGGVYLYRSSKAAVNMVMTSLAQDIEPRGIKVALLHPGWVQTDMGGPNALITPQQSVTGMLKVVTQLAWQDSGRFLGYDGKEVGW